MEKCECNKLLEAVISAKSGKEMLEMFEKMEPDLEEKELGLGLLQVSQKLDSEGHDPEKVLSLAKRALDIFLDFERRGVNLPSPAVGWVTFVLSVLGSSCIKLKNYDESLKYLEWADKNLKKVEEDGGYDPDEHDEFMNCISTVQRLLFKVKEAMGRVDECALHLRKILEVTENKKGIEEDSLEIGKACMDVCQASIVTMNDNEALPLAVKALAIYVKHKGSESVEVGMIRRSLGVIYSRLGQAENDMGLIEKAVEQAQLASSVLGSRGCTYETLVSEFKRAAKLNQLGRYEESIGVLKAVVSSDEADGALLTVAWTSMAWAYCFQNKFKEARDFMETAKKTLEKEQIEPLEMAIAFGDMSLMHQKMNDTDTAISMLRRSLALPNLPEKLIIDQSERLFVLISESYKGERAIQYLDEAVERLKHRLGPKHSVVGNGYNNLGVVASMLGKPPQALIYLQNAKHILDASLGPRHLNSIEVNQSISKIYSNIGRHARAIEYQEKVVEDFKELGASYMDELHSAVSLLHQIRIRGAAGHH